MVDFIFGIVLIVMGFIISGLVSVLYLAKIETSNSFGCQQYIVIIFVTGILGWFISVAIYDLIRWVLKIIMKPDHDIKYFYAG